MLPRSLPFVLLAFLSFCHFQPSGRIDICLSATRKEDGQLKRISVEYLRKDAIADDRSAQGTTEWVEGLIHQGVWIENFVEL